MDFVINDQAPVALIEQVQVGEFGVLARAVSHDLVGCQRHRAHFLGGARVLADGLGGDGGLVEQLLDPLARGRHAGNQDERGGLDQGHAPHPHDGFASAAGQHDHAGAAPLGAAGVKGPGRLLLVAAQGKRAACAGEQAQINGEILPGGVAGQVFGGKAYS